MFLFNYDGGFWGKLPAAQINLQNQLNVFKTLIALNIYASSHLSSVQNFSDNHSVCLFFCLSVYL